MGEVYLAMDHRLQTEVALKQVPLEQALEPGIRAGLVEEARIMAKLSHERIVRLFDLADTEDGMFLVLEYVGGPSFDRVLAANPRRTPEETLHLLREVSEGLTLAHGRGVVHRDLKPSNLLVALEGDDRRRYHRDGTVPSNMLTMHFKVGDFGLAKVVEQLTQARISGRVVGTPYYMAPEQFRGEPPSAETDVYALGVIAYQCLAGRLPLGEADPAYFHIYLTPAPIGGIPAAMERAIQQALSKDRRARFRSVAEFLEAMEGLRPGNAEERSGRRYGKWVAVAATSAVVLGLGALGVWRTWERISQTPRQEAAREETIAEEPELPPLPPLNPAARIDELPPVIEKAARWERPLYPRMIRKPRLEARLRVPDRDIAGFSTTGVVFLGGEARLAAVEGGRLSWSYSMPQDHMEAGLDANGLMWVRSVSAADRLFCFNAAGQGGELTAALRRRLPPLDWKSMAVWKKEGRSSAQCVGAQGGAEPEIAGASGWRVKLDQDCQQEPWPGPEGLVVVQTRSQTVYALSAQGRVRWTHRAACGFRHVLVLSDGSVVGTCEEGRQQWHLAEGGVRRSQKSEHGVSPVAALTDGGYYALWNTKVYDIRLLKAVDAKGAELWSLSLEGSIPPSITVGPQGKLYVLSYGPNPELRVIGDAGQE